MNPGGASLTISIVSHGHGAQVAALVAQLAALHTGHLRRVLVTLNRPEPALQRELDAGSWPFELVILPNLQPTGFAANHNAAFAVDASTVASRYFAVMNPDVRLIADPLGLLIDALVPADVGCAYPVQIGLSGRAQDHERRLPTPLALLQRYTKSEPAGSAASAPDWVNAAFLVFPAPVFAALGGFDSRFHMYCEDVDLCIRMRLAGWRIVRVDAARVLHEGNRATRRSAQHLLWHVRSLVRLWSSTPYRDFKRLQAALH